MNINFTKLNIRSLSTFSMKIGTPQAKLCFLIFVGHPTVISGINENNEIMFLRKKVMSYDYDATEKATW